MSIWYFSKLLSTMGSLMTTTPAWTWTWGCSQYWWGPTSSTHSATSKTNSGRTREGNRLTKSIVCQIRGRIISRKMTLRMTMMEAKMNLILPPVQVLVRYQSMMHNLANQAYPKILTMTKFQTIYQLILMKVKSHHIKSLN
jgi:hypothetical protein